MLQRQISIQGSKLPPSAPHSFAAAHRLQNTHRKVSLRREAAVADAPLSWQDIQHSAGTDLLEGFVVRPGKSPGTAPHPVLPAEPTLTSSKPAIFYRDTNSWCPFCERVWMALLEKGIPFDVIFIDLRNKPDWYEKVVPTKLVPAVAIRGEMVWESDVILKALDKAFPDKPLLPADSSLAAEVDELSQMSSDLTKGGYNLLMGREGGFGQGSADESRVPEFTAAFQQLLSKIETALAKQSSGPYFFGDHFGFVDLMFMPSLERLAAQLPVVRGFQMRGNPDYPNLTAWYDAMDARPAYQQVKTDDKTHHLLAAKFFHVSSAFVEPVDEFRQRARREAAAKLNVNHDRIVNDIAKNCGVASDHGINGYPAAPTQATSAAVDHALRRMASFLLTGAPGPKHKTAKGRAVGAAALAYFRNRASSPRDMTAAAADEMRHACDEVLKDTY